MEKEIEIQFNRIVDLIVNIQNVNRADLYTETRIADVVLARQMIWSISKDLFGIRVTMKEMGRRFGGRNHSTVVIGIKAVHNYIETDRKFRFKYDQIRDMAKVKCLTARKTKHKHITEKLEEILRFNDPVNIKIGIREIIQAQKLSTM